MTENESTRLTVVEEGNHRIALVLASAVLSILAALYVLMVGDGLWVWWLAATVPLGAIWIGFRMHSRDDRSGASIGQVASGPDAGRPSPQAVPRSISGAGEGSWEQRALMTFVRLWIVCLLLHFMLAFGIILGALNQHPALSSGGAPLNPGAQLLAIERIPEYVTLVTVGVLLALVLLDQKRAIDAVGSTPRGSVSQSPAT